MTVPRKGEMIMMTGKEDLLQALVEAYIMEKGTKEFYALAASKSGAAAKKGFESLADWEHKHMLYLQSLYQSLMDDRELLEFEEFSRKVPSPVTESGMPVKDLEKKIETFVIKSEKDALDIAVNIEAKAYNLYKGLAARAQDAAAKVIFEEMMAQETKHMSEITAMKKRLAS
jgi:rubrerythrin